ncbi:MAG: hypothetical protein KAX49_13160 [Halanaerobiales bacterium]|nr:hypothetical protein [Halanaerobiales bacterium]
MRYNYFYKDLLSLFIGYGIGKISFDYGINTIKFGNSISKEESNKIINIIEKYKGLHIQQKVKFLVKPKLRGIAKIQEENKQLIIILPLRKITFLNIFLMLFFISWISGYSQYQQMNIFLIYLWTGISLLILFLLSWNVASKEVIIVSPQEIVIKRMVFSFSVIKKYSFELVTNIRLVSDTNRFLSIKEFWGFGGGVIGFDYKEKTIKFGRSLEEGEGNYLIKTICNWIEDL